MKYGTYQKDRMALTATLFRNSRSQAVRLPVDFRYDETEVYIRRDQLTGDVILSRRPESWEAVRRRVVTIPIRPALHFCRHRGGTPLWSSPPAQSTRLLAVVEQFLLSVTILPWDSDAACHYGILRAALEQCGQMMGNLDMMIGAHTLARHAVLVKQRPRV